MEIKRRKTARVLVGNVALGGLSPTVIQAMTDTPTADINATYKQTEELIIAGAELVRWTVNDESAAQAVPKIVQRLHDRGYQTPIIGDFHFNGHKLLAKFPRCAKALSKYRINPGNIGQGKRHNENFQTMIKLAIQNQKAVRIGVNWGSLDQELFSDLTRQNARRKKPFDVRTLICQAMVESAVLSAQEALKLGLAKKSLVLSVKMSHLQDMVNVYTQLAAKGDWALHLGLTEAGGDLQGTVSSSAALAILLQKGIGDTIRISLTPQPGTPRTREVEVCKTLLQAMGLRFFHPSVFSCPGCGRTTSTHFQTLAEEIRRHVLAHSKDWKIKYPGVEKLKIAVMGCVVNGPGESRHADVGISLPGQSEQPMAPVYIDGKKVATLKGEKIQIEFINLLEDYIHRRFS